MKILFVALCCWLVSGFGGTAETIALFNGEDLSGWRVECLERDAGKRYWSVTNGCIQVDTRGDRDHDYVWLTHEREFDDFELTLKVRSLRMTDGNSGVQIRSRFCELPPDAKDSHFMCGPQIDIHPPNPIRVGLIYDETVGAQRWIFPSRKKWDLQKYRPRYGTFGWYVSDNVGENKTVGWAIRMRSEPVLTEAERAAGWNHLRIRAQGFHIYTEVNGIPVAEYYGGADLRSEHHRRFNVGRSGHIALQLHSRDDLALQFKDLELTELPESPPEILEKLRAAFAKLQAEPWCSGWHDATLARGGEISPFAANEQLDRTPMRNVLYGEVERNGEPAGYLMLNASPPHELIDFGIDAAQPLTPGNGCATIPGVPNLQQFPVILADQKIAASGCVPTATANALFYWSEKEFPDCLPESPDDAPLPHLARHLRSITQIGTIPDTGRYTENWMDLTGSSSHAMAAALARYLDSRNVPLSASVKPLDHETAKTEIAAAHPVLLSCTCRLPHKPYLNWGHFLTIVGWAELDDEFFYIVHDNFYPSRHPQAVRLLAHAELERYRLKELMTLSP